jgi:pimeloyl-ACP methyl ester carboxylesterase
VAAVGQSSPASSGPWAATVESVTTGRDDHRTRRERCTTPDGIGIAVYDFGGSGDDLLLVHATGFCAEVFGPLARALHGNYHCWGLDLRAHGRSDRPGDGNFAWSGFAVDVLSVIDHLGLERPLAFGHSCGGAALLLAEEARTGTFRALYCFEPVVMDEAGGQGTYQGNPLSVGARRRRETFPSAEDAFVNFSAKPPFADLDPEVLELYVETGFEVIPTDEGGDGRAIRLRCRRDDEAEIYAHGASHGAFGHLNEIQCPVSLSCGAHTDAFGISFIEADAAQIDRSTVEVVPEVGHFGPLQRPGLVASSVDRALSRDSGTPRP